MDNLERLAVLTALQKAVKQQVDALRAEVKADLKKEYDDDGTVKKALRVNGEKVGNILITFYKPKYEINSHEEFDDFALCNGLAEIKEEIIPAYMHQAIEVLKRELPEAISEHVETTPDWDKYFDHIGDMAIMAGTDQVVPGVRWVPDQLKDIQVRECKPEVVIPLVNSLSEASTLLLGDGGGQ